MGKGYLKFSILLNWVFVVSIILLLVRFNVFEHIFSASSANTDTEQINSSKSYSSIFSKMDNTFTKVKGAENLYTLPSPQTDGKVSLEKTLQNRRSRREFKDIALTAKEVSQILWAAYGITKPLEKPNFVRGGLKTAPSAGARYPLDIYLIAGNINGLTPGMYKYIPSGHKLIKLIDGDVRKELFEACWYQDMILQAPITIAYTATFERTTIKYGKRGRERYVCMDLGHSGQNVYLQAEAIGLGTCAIGAFEDKDVSKILKFPDKEEILYLMPIGHY